MHVFLVLLEIHACSNPSLSIQGTISSKHEVFGDCCHAFLYFRYFCKKCENNEKMISFNYKIYNLHIFFSQ